MSPLAALMVQDVVLKGRREGRCHSTEVGTSLSVRLWIVYSESGTLWNSSSECQVNASLLQKGEKKICDARSF